MWQSLWSSVVTEQKCFSRSLKVSSDCEVTTSAGCRQWHRNEFESGGTGPERKWGAPIRREGPEKISFGRAPPLIGSKSTISRFGERFRDGQYSLLFSYSPCPPCLAVCKSGGGARAPVPYGVSSTGRRFHRRRATGVGLNIPNHDFVEQFQSNCLLRDFAFSIHHDYKSAVFLVQR